MIKSSVTIALVPQISNGPWIYWEPLEISIRKAAALGFDGVELFTASASAVDVNELQKILNRYEMKLSAVGTGAGKVIMGLTLTDPDEEIRRKAVSFIREMIIFGAQFNAPAIIGSMQGRFDGEVIRQQAIEWLSEGLNELGTIAEKNDVPLILEPLNRYETNLLNRVESVAGVIGNLNTKNVKILADLFHMNIEEQSIAGTIIQYGKLIGHVHFADSNRQPIGNGHLSMPEIAEALNKIGYEEYLSAEAFPFPNPDQAAAKTIESFKQYFKTIRLHT
jgi:sugar phosphate isomerase/epimerase